MTNDDCGDTVSDHIDIQPYFCGARSSSQSNQSKEDCFHGDDLHVSMPIIPLVCQTYKHTHHSRSQSPSQTASSLTPSTPCTAIDSSLNLTVPKYPSQALCPTATPHAPRLLLRCRHSPPRALVQCPYDHHRPQPAKACHGPDDMHAHTECHQLP